MAVLHGWNIVQKKTCQKLVNNINGHITSLTDTKLVSANYMVLACGVTSVIVFIGIFVGFLVN